MSVTAARDPHADESGHEGPTTAAEELARRSHTVTQRVQHFVQEHPSISPALILVITGIVFHRFSKNRCAEIFRAIEYASPPSVGITT